MKAKIKTWIKDNGPKLTENKYVGLAYDRFASLPPNQQRQLTIAVFTAIILVVVLFLGSSYLSLWSFSKRSSDAEKMIMLIQKFQKDNAETGNQMAALGRNNLLAGRGALKNHLISRGRSASISPRMLTVEETTATTQGGEEGKDGEKVRTKRATVKLERVNLNQLIGFLQAVEFGSYDLSISSLTIQNDDKVRGYMDVDLGIVAYLFEVNEEG